MGFHLEKWGTSIHREAYIVPTLGTDRTPHPHPNGASLDLPLQPEAASTSRRHILEGKVTGTTFCEKKVCYKLELSLLEIFA